MKDFSLKFVLFIMLVNVSVFGQEASINSIYEIKETKTRIPDNKPVTAYEWPNTTSCFDQNSGESAKVVLYTNPAVGTPEFYLVFTKNGVPDNTVLAPFLDYSIKITLQSKAGISHTHVFENSIRNFLTLIDRQTIIEEPLYLNAGLANWLPYPEALGSVIIELTNVGTNCVPTYDNCFHTIAIDNIEYLSEPKDFMLSLFDIGCAEFNHNIACDLLGFFRGDVYNEDLIVSTTGLSVSWFNGILGTSSKPFSKINILIKGFNGASSEYREIEFYDSGNPNFFPETYTDTLPNFGGYLEYQYYLVGYYDTGGRFKCKTPEILNVNNNFTICDALSLLKYHKTGLNTDKLQFDFVEPSNSLSLFDKLNLYFEMDSLDLGNLLSPINRYYFDLYYYEGSVEKHQRIERTNLSLADFKQLTLEFDSINFTAFSGYLRTTVFRSNQTTLECNDINVSFENIPDPEIEIPSNTCDPAVVNAGNLSQVLYSGNVEVGSIFTANNFPLVVTAISSGNNNSGIYGKGIVPLPFQGKQLIVDLINVKFNEDSKMIQGELNGEKGEFNLGLSDLPLNIGGEICLPPPPPPGFNNNGVNTATGLNQYGFNPITGLHWNGTPFDNGGFNINGIHKDTNMPYNKDGCTRDGYHYQTHEKCDPLGGIPEELNTFVTNLFASQNINTLINQVLDSLIAIRQANLPDCNSSRNVLLNSNLSDEYTLCVNNVLAAEGMSKSFDRTPISIPEQYAARNSNQIAYEKEHIKLFECDQNKQKASEAITKLQFIKAHIAELRGFLEGQMRNLKQGDFDRIQTTPGLKAWIAFQIGLYLEQNPDLGYIDDMEKFPFTSSPIYSSWTGTSIEIVRNKTTKKEVVDELRWLYNNNFEILNDVPRGYYSELICQNRASVDPGPFANVLPIPFTIEKANHIYTLYIEDVVIYPTSSYLDVTAVFKDKRDNTTLAFGGTHIPFFGGGINTEDSKIYLKNDVSVKLINSMKLHLKKGQNETFIKWNCDGIDLFSISGYVEFCSNYISPLNTDLTPMSPDSLYKIDFKATFKDWLDFTFKVKGRPFVIKGMEDFPIEVDTVTLDFSKNLSINIDVPVGYTHSFYNNNNNTFDPLWKGVGFEDLTVHLPKSIIGGDSTHLGIGVEKAIFDETGFSGILYAERLVDIEEGSLSEWAFSVDGISILFLHNSLSGGGLRGKIGVPVLKNPLDYSGVITSSKQFKLQVFVKDTNELAVFNCKLKLEENSSVTINYNHEKKDFSIEAFLHGSIRIVSDTGKLAKLALPAVTFQNFIIKSKGPDFSPGTWGIDGFNMTGGGTGFNPKFDAFGVSIDSIYPYKGGANDEIYLGISFKAEVIDSFLSAHGIINIIGKIKHDEKGRQVWRYDRVRIGELCITATFKSTFSLDACIQFFDSHPTYGSGFRGAGMVKFGGIGTEHYINAVCQFGKIGETQKYFFVDVMYVSAQIAQIGPLTLTGLGGGISKGMYPNYPAGVFPINNFTPESYLETPLGTTMSGVVYLPDAYWGWEFKLMTKFKIGADQLAYGFGEFIVRLNNTGALEEIELRATAAVLGDLDISGTGLIKQAFPSIMDSMSLSKAVKAEDVPKPTAIDAAIKGFMSVKINFKRQEFHGQMSIYLNAPGLTGRGPGGSLVMAEAFISKKDWYIYMGKPDEGQRCGMILNAAGLLNVEVSNYLTAGTIVPGFPGLPKNVRHLASEITILESMRKSGLGFAFGASLDLKLSIDIAIASATVNAGLGFDMMLKKYEGIGCFGGPSQVGINGWYAMGQMWAYLNGRLEVCGFNVLSTGVAAVLQAQLPNPTWVRGSVEIKVETLLYDGTYNAEIEIGERCKFSTADSLELLGLELYRNVNAEDNSRVDIFFRPQTNFSVPLNRALKVDVGNGMEDFTFTIDFDSTNIYHGNLILPHVKKYNTKYLTSLTLVPDQVLPSNDSIVVFYKINIFKNGNYFASARKRIKLFTSSKTKYIPLVNIEYAYPVNGMTNYYRNENLEYKGFIKLISGQGYLFNNQNDIIQAVFTGSSGNKILSNITYNYMDRLIKFDMDPSNFTPGEKYRIDIVLMEGQTATSGFENSNNPGNSGAATNNNALDKATILYTAYFRCSNFDKFEDKIIENTNQLRNEADNGTDRSFNGYEFQSYTINLTEKLDAFELEGEKRLVKASIDNDLFYKSPINLPLLFTTKVSPLNNNLYFNKGFYTANEVIPYVKLPIYDKSAVDETNFNTSSNVVSNFNQTWATAIPYFMNNNLEIANSNLIEMIDDYSSDPNYYNNGTLEGYLGETLANLYLMLSNNQDLWYPITGKLNFRLKYVLPDGKVTYNSEDLECKSISDVQYINISGN